MWDRCAPKRHRGRAVLPEKGDVDAAIDHASGRGAGQTRYAILFCLLGEAQEKKGLKRDAIKSYTRYLDLSPRRGRQRQDIQEDRKAARGSRQIKRSRVARFSKRNRKPDLPRARMSNALRARSNSEIIFLRREIPTSANQRCSRIFWWMLTCSISW
jgi:hypothetical protein